MRKLINNLLLIGTLLWGAVLPAQIVLEALEAPQYSIGDDCSARNNIVYADNNKRDNTYTDIYLYVPSTPKRDVHQCFVGVEENGSRTCLKKKLNEIDFQKEIKELMSEFNYYYSNNTSISFPTQVEIGLKYKSGWEYTGQWAYGVNTYVTYRSEFINSTYEKDRGLLRPVDTINGSKVQAVNALTAKNGNWRCIHSSDTQKFDDPETLWCKNLLLPGGSLYNRRLEAEAYIRELYSKDPNFVSIRFEIVPVKFTIDTYAQDKKKCTITID